MPRKINALKRFYQKTSVYIFCSMILIYSCKKGIIDSDTSSAYNKLVLSSSSLDYQERLQKIKANYYKQNLQNKFITKVKKDVFFVPDWSNPKLQVVNDSVSYVFYKMLAFVNRDKKKVQAREINGNTYLMIKNETEFYKAFYYKAGDKNTEAHDEVSLENFSGKLLLENLHSGKHNLIEYKNGTLSDAYRKLEGPFLKKLQSVGGTISYYEQICHSEMRYCTYVSDSYTYCGGLIEVVYSEYCYWPSPRCGATFYMIDYSEVNVCDEVWFPDPPINPGDGGGGSGGGSAGLSDASISSATVYDDGRPKIDDIKKYTNCFNDNKPAQSYTMTIFVDQPVNGSDDAYSIVDPGVIVNNPYGVPSGIVWTTPDGTFFNVGHTFVTFEKNNIDGTNVRQTLGFYPSSNPLVSKGAMENNSGHAADVSYTINVNASQFADALQKVESDFLNQNYVLTNVLGNEYNCTDAAISWMNAGGANLSNSPSGLFANTPGKFGQALRLKPGANTNPQDGIIGKGPCN
jgi:hypothetical protein